MKAAVLGATGRTGRLIVEELLRRGHEVTALVRDPAGAGLPGAVSLQQGDARAGAALRTLATGADVVVSALGPRKGDRTLHREIAPLLVEAMTGSGVDRYVGISGAGIDVPGDAKSLRDRLISTGIQRLGGNAAKDKVLEYEAWAASGLGWTLVRPPRLLDGPATGDVEHDAHRSPRSTAITRSDLAVFVVDAIEQDGYLRQAPLVAAAKR